MFKHGGEKSEENVIKSKKSNNGSKQNTKNHISILNQIINEDSRKERQANNNRLSPQKFHPEAA